MKIIDNTYLHDGGTIEWAQNLGFLLIILAIVALMVTVTLTIATVESYIPSTGEWVGVMVSWAVLAMLVVASILMFQKGGSEETQVEGNFYNQLLELGFTDIDVDTRDDKMTAKKDGELGRYYFVTEDNHNWKIIDDE